MPKQLFVIVATAFGVSCGTSSELAVFQFPAADRAVAIERQPSHWYLAEYRRALILESSGRPVARVAMFGDSGGYSRANLYRVTETIFLVRDADASYTIDVAEDTVVQDQERRSSGTFVGSFDVDASRTWRFISANERAELSTEFRGG